MSFESFVITLGSNETQVYRMPAYTKTESGEYAILPRTGATRVSAYNANGSAEDLTIKLKTIFDLEPQIIGAVNIPAGEVVQWPVPISLGPGDYVTGISSASSSIILSGSVAASPIAPQTAANETIWTPFVMRRPIDHTIAWAVASRTYGAAAAGGFFMGVIDTITGTIDAADAYQTGDRYALLGSPKNLEGGRGTSTGDLQWDTRAASSPTVTGAMTRWNGLAATNAVLALGDVEHEVHNYIDGLRGSNPPPQTEGGSDLYLPAMDEKELLYRNGKPNGEDNRTDTQGGTSSFPATKTTHGVNPSSDPTGAGYTNNPRNPDESPLAAFMAGGSQVMDLARYWTTTEADAVGDSASTSRRAWRQVFSRSGLEGFQNAFTKDSTNGSVRPVRRVVL